MFLPRPDLLGMRTEHDAQGISPLASINKRDLHLSEQASLVRLQVRKVFEQTGHERVNFISFLLIDYFSDLLLLFFVSGASCTRPDAAQIARRSDRLAR